MKFRVLLIKIYLYIIHNKKNELHYDISINGVVVVITWNQLYRFDNHQLKVIHSCRVLLITLHTT